MFGFSCNYSPNSLITQCVDSILKYHPDDKVVITDSQSEDKSYYEQYIGCENIIILDNLNKNRQVGSFQIIYDHFPNESYYVMIHDSLFFKKSIQKFLDSSEEFISFMYFPETFNTETKNFCVDVFDNTPYQVPNVGTQINATFGPLFIIKNSLIKKIKDNNLLIKLKSNSKFEDQHFERIIGIWAEQEGYSPEKNNMEGECLSRWGEIVSDNLEYFTKTFLTRS